MLQSLESIAYRQVNLTLETFCLIILTVVLVCSLVDTKSKNASYIWYLLLIAGTYGMLFGDMADWKFSGTPGDLYHGLMWSGLILFYVSSGVTVLAMVFYTISFLKEKGAIHYRITIVATIVVCTVQILLAITTYWHHLVFYIDETNTYVRGPLFILSQAVLIIYFFLFAVLIVNKGLINSKETIFIFAFVSLPIYGAVLQALFYGVAVIAPASTLAMLVALVFINMEERITASEKMYLDVRIEREKLQQQNEFIEKYIVSQIINVVSRTVEAKDTYTQGHSSRVAKYTRELIFRMGGDEEEQRQAYYAGLLHDVGKIRIPDGIINKNGRLDDDEYEVIRLHTVAGYHILKDVNAIPNLSIGARWHHERYDGTGYPNGLEGENIPYIARVIAVADAYDAMTSNRSYRETMPKSKVRSEIEKGMGTQFDPKIAQVMIEMIDEDINFEMRQQTVFRNTTILILDDDKIVHKQIHKAFESADYVLTSAYSPNEAVELLKTEQFDLILLDQQMPGMTGIDFMKWLNANTPKTKVIMLTGDKDLELIKQGEEAGIKDFVTKPVRLSTLRECVQDVLLH